MAYTTDPIVVASDRAYGSIRYTRFWQSSMLEDLGDKFSTRNNLSSNNAPRYRNARNNDNRYYGGNT